MEQNEQKKTMNPLFVEPEKVEDIPLTRFERMKEGMRNIRCTVKRIRWPRISAALTAAVAALLLLALIAAPVLPFAALIALLVRCCRSVLRAQTA